MRKKFNVRWWIPIIGLASFAVAGFLSVVAFQEMRRPDDHEMRKYRLARLTDAQLRELHKEAVRLAAERQIAIVQEKDRNLKMAAEQSAECARKMQDPAFRARTGGCNLFPLGGTLLAALSEDEFFERLIMGICRFAGSVHEARKLRCLPPRPWTSREGWIDP